ncbi:hypothetical protein [Phaffia rhodozyma]|uniref:G-patch domain-containing protein n=1 Tax=Phaffia rhodozyma TaxID=264483 RepID=A0A0F7SWW2_PHARH|nr:hypothetical protein [Phaffia rhodozyma]
MSFDAGAHLKKQGWKGKGEAFKQGHLSRPLPVKVKNNLGGVGKDRIEDFPFWDHVFAAAASSIIIPSPSSSGSSDVGSPAPEESPSVDLVPQTIHRTLTGIISPYAPTHHSSKLATVSPATPTEPSSALNLNHFAYAKRVLAKRELYERFYKGRTIATTLEEAKVPLIVTPPPVLLTVTASTESSSSSSKKRKASKEVESEAERKLRKDAERLKKHVKKMKKEEKKDKKEKKAKKESKRPNVVT